MEEALRKEVERLKEELARRKEEIQDIRDLVREEIDRPFRTDPNELSEREFETFFRERLAELKLSTDVNPDPQALRSHRKIIGRLILFLKRKFMSLIRFYTQQITPKQTQFNVNSASLLEAVFAFSKRKEKELHDIEERMSRLEETLVLLLARLKDLKEELDKPAHQSPEVVTAEKK